MDPINIALDLVNSVVLLAAEAKNNREDCQLLAKLAGETGPFLKNLEERSLDDPLLLRALESLTSALEEAQKAIDQCRKTSFFVGMVCSNKHNHSLKEAATSLAHALDQIPMAALGMTTDIHDCLFSLKEDLEQAQFRQTAESMKQTKHLKDELERAFNDSRQGNEEVKQMIQDMLHSNASTTEQRMTDMEELQTYLAEAKRNKETMEAFQLQQLMDAIAESVREDTAPKGPSKEVIDLVKCPIGGEIMIDPVVLKDSYMTYDRHNIEDWMRQGHRKDPVTHAEIVSCELISNIAIRGLARTICGKEAKVSVYETQEERPAPKLRPGMYEGMGTVSKEDGSMDHSFVVLVLEPDGNVQGYLIPHAAGDEQPKQETRILVGKWHPDRDTLFFSDAELSNQGTVVINASSQQMTFSLEGESRSASHPAEAVAQFHFKHLTSPPLLYNYLVLPGLLEMEGTIEGSGSRLSNKLALVLDGDGSLRGWMSAERDDGRRLIAHALRGTWDSTGLLSFCLYFPHEKLSLESVQNPVHYLACYKLEGTVGETEYAGGTMGPSFGGTITKTPSEDTSPSEDGGPLGVVPDRPGSFAYNCFRIPGRRPPQIIRRDLNLLRLPNESDGLVKPGVFTIRARLPPGEEGKDHYLCVHHQYDDDVRSEKQSYCIWHSDASRATRWSIQPGHRLDDYYISIHSHPDDSVAAVGQDLTVHERDVLERKRNAAFQYMITSSREESNTWNLNRKGSCYVAVVYRHAYDRAGFTEGYVLANPLAGSNRRDEESYYARISSLPAKAIEIQLEDQHTVPSDGLPQASL